MLYSGNIYNSDKLKFEFGSFKVEDGKFIDVNFEGEINEKEKNDKNFIIPGLIDLHSHGAAGVDIFGADYNQIAQMCDFYAKNGVTSLFCTSMSESKDKILRMIEEVKKAKKIAKINLAGIHLEGPYINKNKAGAHDKNFIRDVNLNELSEICDSVLDLSLGLNLNLKLHVTLAPEIDGGLDAIKLLKSKGASISLGHTEANGEIIKQAIELGANSFTHLFNAMTGIHHREIGVAGHGLACDNAYCEIICDGVHIMPEVVKIAAWAKGFERVLLVSDSMCAAGLEDGEYNLGGLPVDISKGKAVLKGTDTIAGSVTNLWNELNNFVKFSGYNFERALICVTKNPADCVDLNGKGAVKIGFDADFVILNECNVGDVFVNGKKV